MPQAAVSIDISVADSQDLISLYRWLRDIDGVGVDLVPRRAAPGEMGDVWEFLTVTCGSGGVAVTALQALRAWLESRRSTVVVKVRVPGQEVEVSAQTAEEILPILLPILDRVLSES